MRAPARPKQALAIDLIAGVMSGAGFGAGVKDQYTDFTAPQGGHFFLAVDIGQVMPLESYTGRVEAFCTDLKAKRAAPGVAEILLPGESKARHERENRSQGISIDPILKGDLNQLADHCDRPRLRTRRQQS